MGIFIYHIFFWVSFCFVSPKPATTQELSKIERFQTAFCEVYARTGQSSRDVSLFLVEKGTPGFSLGQKIEAAWIAVVLMLSCCPCLFVKKWMQTKYWKCTLEDLGPKGGWNPWFAETEDIYPTNLPLIPAIFCWLTSCYPPPKFSETWDRTSVACEPPWRLNWYFRRDIQLTFSRWHAFVFLCAISYHFIPFQGMLCTLSPSL